MCPPAGSRAPKNHPLTPGATITQVPQKQQQMMLLGAESVKLGETPLPEPRSPTGKGQEGPLTPLAGTAQLRRQPAWGWLGGHGSSADPLWLQVAGWLAADSALTQTSFASLAFSLNEFLLSRLLFLASG